MQESLVTRLLIYESYSNVKRNTRIPIPEGSKMVIGAKFACALFAFHDHNSYLRDYIATTHLSKSGLHF